MELITKQSAPNAATWTTLYTVPANKATVISTINICNFTDVATLYKIVIRVGGVALENKHYIYSMYIGGYDTFQATFGGTMNEGDVIDVYANDATLSFNLFGQENDI